MWTSIFAGILWFASGVITYGLISTDLKASLKMKSIKAFQIYMACWGPLGLIAVLVAKWTALNPKDYN